VIPPYPYEGAIGQHLLQATGCCKIYNLPLQIRTRATNKRANNSGTKNLNSKQYVPWIEGMSQTMQWIIAFCPSSNQYIINDKV
jgi:hypothetical protein